jgi:spore coat protein CotH
MADSPRPLTALKRRLPVKLRQHWKLVAASIAFVAVLALGFGGAMVRPTITSALSTQEELVEDIDGDTEFFDSGEHSVEISYDETEYRDMIAEFQSSGEKNFIRADVTIDGTLIENVGLRLKGNSTLMSLKSTDGGEGGPGGGGMPGGGMGQTELSFDDPQSLPWLISFDEYEEGRAYGGDTQMSLRPATSGSSTAVNEALALAMTAESGQTTQDYTVASVSVNGGESTSRIVVDLPDGQWANDLGNGVLYKASADGGMDYLGEDPTDYEEAFTQINAVGTYDMEPVMRLLDFVNNSSDEDFAENLDDYVDVDSFAEYLAMQSLLSNGDAMDGPGNNYYLWYDTDTEKFSVLSWDLNMSLSGMGGGMGGGVRGGMDSGKDTAAQADATGEDAGQMPAMPEGMEMPEGAPDGAEGGPGGGGPEGSGGAGRGSGILKERFLANEDFAALYEEAYSDLYEQLIASGYAQETLDEIVARATEAGDTGAEALGETISGKLASTAATSTAEDAEQSSMGGGGGRPE